MKFCLVDWEISKNIVVPWMIFDTLKKCVEIRREAHSSWPKNVAEIEDKPCKSVPSRRAIYSKRGETYFTERVDAHKTYGKIQPFYEI
jgi:hypothetical protein